LDLINSWILQQKNSKLSILVQDQEPLKKMFSLYQKNILLILSIGERKELLPLSKIKDNVDHVGLFPPQELWKDSLVFLELNHYHHSLNNNWLIAQDHSVTKDVTEDLWMMHSNLLKKTVLQLNQPILMMQEMEAVKKKQELSRSNLSMMFLKEM
jgi:hypothetical protein